MPSSDCSSSYQSLSGFQDGYFWSNTSAIRVVSPYLLAKNKEIKILKICPSEYLIQSRISKKTLLRQLWIVLKKQLLMHKLELFKSNLNWKKLKRKSSYNNRRKVYNRQKIIIEVPALHLIILWALTNPILPTKCKMLGKVQQWDLASIHSRRE